MRFHSSPSRSSIVGHFYTTCQPRHPPTPLIHPVTPRTEPSRKNERLQRQSDPSSASELELEAARPGGGFGWSWRCKPRTPVEPASPVTVAPAPSPGRAAPPRRCNPSSLQQHSKDECRPMGGRSVQGCGTSVWASQDRRSRASAARRGMCEREALLSERAKAWS